MLASTIKAQHLGIATQRGVRTSVGAPEPRVLSLKIPRILGRPYFLFAVVEDAQAPDEICNELERAFSDTGLGDRLGGIDLEAHVSHAVQTIADRYARGGRQPQLVLALWSGRKVTTGCLGDGDVCVCRGRSVTRAWGRGSPYPSVRTARFHILPDDCLVLMGAAAASQVGEHELLETILRSASPNAAATWLANLAAVESRRDSSVLVVYAGRHDDPDMEEPKGFREAWRRWRALVGSVGISAALLLAGVFFIPLRLSLLPTTPVGATQMPAGLKTDRTTPAETDFSWSPVSGAIGYFVTVEGKRYTSEPPRLSLAGVLQPGQLYHWTVQATFDDHVGPPSHLAAFSVPPLRRLPALVVTGPPLVYRPRALGPVSFCWTTPPVGQRFDLYVTGGTTHFHDTLSFPTGGQAGTHCIGVSLRPNVAYSWRLGASLPEYTPRWTPWQTFWYASPRSNVSFRPARRAATYSPPRPALVGSGSGATVRYPSARP